MSLLLITSFNTVEGKPTNRTLPSSEAVNFRPETPRFRVASEAMTDTKDLELDTGLLVIVTRYRHMFHKTLGSTHDILKKKDTFDYKSWGGRNYVILVGKDAIEYHTNVRPYDEADARRDLFPKEVAAPNPMFPALVHDTRRLAPTIDYASALWETTEKPYDVPGPLNKDNSCAIDAVWWICQNLRLGHVHVDQMTNANQLRLSPTTALFLILQTSTILKKDRHSVGVGRDTVRNLLMETHYIQNDVEVNVGSCLALLTNGIPQVTWSSGRAEVCGEEIIKSRNNNATWKSMIEMKWDEIVNAEKNGLHQGLQAAAARYFAAKSRQSAPREPCESKEAHQHRFLNVVWDRVPPTLFIDTSARKSPDGESSGLKVQSRSSEELEDKLELSISEVFGVEIRTYKVDYYLVGITLHYGGFHYVTMWKGDDKRIRYFDDLKSGVVQNCDTWYDAAQHGKNSDIALLVYRREYMIEEHKAQD